MARRDTLGSARDWWHDQAWLTGDPLRRIRRRAGDLDGSGRARLSYRRAAELFEQATAELPGGPCTLHHLRRSALTHAAEDCARAAHLRPGNSNADRHLDVHHDRMPQHTNREAPR
jgi:hypothetical protein